MTTLNAPISDIPTIDFKSLLNLQDDDKLEGYRLCLGKFIHVNLKPIEEAYLAADAAGLHKETLVKFRGSAEVAVVLGRNLSVMSSIGTPSRYPVLFESGRGIYEYSVSDAQSIQLPIAVVGLLKEDASIVEGMLTEIKVTPISNRDARADVVIDGRIYPMRSFSTLEVVE